MSEFLPKILVEQVEEYFKVKKHIHGSGYSPPMGKRLKLAEDKIFDQVKLYKAAKQQLDLKLNNG